MADRQNTAARRIHQTVGPIKQGSGDMRPRLRLFTGDDNSTTVADPPMTVRLGEISDILADAANTRRTWLEDFADDEVQVSADLYEVLSMYWRLRPSA